MASAKVDDKNRVRVASGLARRYAAEARSVIEKLTQRNSESSINELEPADKGAEAESGADQSSNRKI